MPCSNKLGKGSTMEVRFHCRAQSLFQKYECSKLKYIFVGSLLFEYALFLCIFLKTSRYLLFLLYESQKQHQQMFIGNIHREASALESLFNKVADLQDLQVFSCEYCDTFKNSFFDRTLPLAAFGISVDISLMLPLNF